MDGELIIQILLLLASVYLAFFKSYLTEKGKSAALKEDLNDLTIKVESVKSEFVKEQEILKTDLQRVLSNEVSYRNEERTAIISYHGIINEWLYSIDEIGFGNYNKSNIDTLIDVRIRIARFYAKAGISQSKVSLLVENKNLVKITGKLYMQVFAYYHWADKYFLQLQQNLESQKLLTDGFSIIIKNIKGNNLLADKMARHDEKLIKENKKLFENYYKEKGDERKKTFPIENQYESLVKEYLKE